MKASVVGITNELKSWRVRLFVLTNLDIPNIVELKSYGVFLDIIFREDPSATYKIGQEVELKPL